MSILHVSPVGDTYQHETDGAPCDCNPRLEQQESGDIIMIHNAWDGREIFEQLGEE